MDRSAPDSVAAERTVLEAFLSVPLSGLDPGTDGGPDGVLRRMHAPGRQRALEHFVTFNSGI